MRFLRRKPIRPVFLAELNGWVGIAVQDETPLAKFTIATVVKAEPCASEIWGICVEQADYSFYSLYLAVLACPFP